MNKIDKKRSPLLIITAVLLVIMAIPVVSYAAQKTVNLGTTSTFAVLAATTITNTGPTVINGSSGGDVGVYAGSEFTGQAEATISGAVHLADAVAGVAQEDLVTAYNDAAGRTPVTTIPTELGGTTLKPGVYDSESGTFEITGTLTLDAEGDPDGVFIFLTDSTLVTMPNSMIDLLNSARFCRIFWQVGTSATLGTNSHFVGHIFAMESIDAQKGAIIQGQLLARTGAVTLNNNTITNGLCATTQTDTVSGGELPTTATPWYSILLAGVGMVLVGVVLWSLRRRDEYDKKNLE